MLLTGCYCELGLPVVARRMEVKLSVKDGYLVLARSVQKVYKVDDTKFCYQLIMTVTKFVIFRVFVNQSTRNSDRFFC